MLDKRELVKLLDSTVGNKSALYSLTVMEAVNSMISSQGYTWQSLLLSQPTNKTAQAITLKEVQSDELDARCAFIREHMEAIDEGARKFISSVVGFYEKNKKLSDKQLVAIEKFYFNLKKRRG